MLTKQPTIYIINTTTRLTYGYAMPRAYSNYAYDILYKKEIQDKKKRIVKESQRSKVLWFLLHWLLWEALSTTRGQSR